MFSLDLKKKVFVLAGKGKSGGVRVFYYDDGEQLFILGDCEASLTDLLTDFLHYAHLHGRDRAELQVREALWLV